MPVKEITSACHCAIVIPTERSDEGSLFFHNYCQQLVVRPHEISTEPSQPLNSIFLFIF